MRRFNRTVRGGSGKRRLPGVQRARSLRPFGADQANGAFGACDDAQATSATTFGSLDVCSSFAMRHAPQFRQQGQALKIAGVDGANVEDAMWANVATGGFAFAAGAIDKRNPGPGVRGAPFTRSVCVARSSARLFGWVRGFGHGPTLSGARCLVVVRS